MVSNGHAVSSAAQHRLGVRLKGGASFSCFCKSTDHGAPLSPEATLLSTSIAPVGGYLEDQFPLKRTPCEVLCQWEGRYSQINSHQPTEAIGFFVFLVRVRERDVPRAPALLRSSNLG